jgi:hypothetical protein
MPFRVARLLRFWEVAMVHKFKGDFRVGSEKKKGVIGISSIGAPYAMPKTTPLSGK